jgi:hypothetical protein
MAIGRQFEYQKVIHVVEKVTSIMVFLFFLKKGNVKNIR